MSTLLRWFSPAYRYALQAEAAGRYVDAARAYALCGQRQKVAEMHLLEAERRGASASALRELHVAAHFAKGNKAGSKALRLRLGKLYLRVLKKSVLTPTDHELCHEAAELLLSAGDPAGAGAAYELSGDLEQAAAAYEQAGDIERVEALLGTMEAQRRTNSEERQSLATYHMHMELGQRTAALEALRRYVKVTTGCAAAEAERLLVEFKKRRLLPGQVRLRDAASSGEVLYVGRFPLLVGRLASATFGAPPKLLPLCDPGLSREHALIDCKSSGDARTFVLRDLGSKNGTTLGGLPISGELPLRGEGEIGLGPYVVLQFTAFDGVLRLHVLRGLGRGQKIVASPGPIGLLDHVELRFCEEEELPSLALSETADSVLVLNGKRVPREIQLLSGDVIEVDGHRYEVS